MMGSRWLEMYFPGVPSALSLHILCSVRKLRSAPRSRANFVISLLALRLAI